MTLQDLHLVTDRTIEDAAFAKRLDKAGWSNLSDAEKELWDAGLKGSYTANDMNRVGQAVKYISERLTQFGYTVSVNPVLTWKDESRPTEKDFRAYLDDIRTLRGVLEVSASTPRVPPDMDGLSIQEANDIEQILLDIDFVIVRIIGSFKRSDQFTFWSGNEVPLPAAESYMGRTWGELDAMNTTWANWEVADWYLLLYGNLKANPMDKLIEVMNAYITDDLSVAEVKAQVDTNWFAALEFCVGNWSSTAESTKITPFNKASNTLKVLTKTRLITLCANLERTQGVTKDAIQNGTASVSDFLDWYVFQYYILQGGQILSNVIPPAGEMKSKAECKELCATKELIKPPYFITY